MGTSITERLTGTENWKISILVFKAAWILKGIPGGWPLLLPLKSSGTAVLAEAPGFSFVRERLLPVGRQPL